MLIERPIVKQAVKKALKRSRVVALIGPRQCGKTTIARQFVSPESLNYFDLENPISLSRLTEPITALTNLKGTIVIDEVQKHPELFSSLRVLVDRKPTNGQFLILGSASPPLLRQSAESLAGRIETIQLAGFSLSEVGIEALNKHWLRGGFPRSFLAASNKDSFSWRQNFIQTFLERDVPQFGLQLASSTLLRFWKMLAHYHGQIWNAAELAQALNISQSTTGRYVDLLEDLFMVRQLKPWHSNIKKRQVKAAKVYVRDCGLLHQLLGLESLKQLLEHPKCGASWEGYVIEEILKSVPYDEAYFWATHNGAELDLLLVKSGRFYGIECKRADAPRLTPSMHSALNDLKLEKLTIIYPGETPYKLTDKVYVMPLSYLAADKSRQLIMPDKS
jgi:predicted AAA+ superfamily ATPase